MSEAPKKRWYVVQAFSGFEGRVATSLREHIKLHNMEELFGVNANHFTRFKQRFRTRLIANLLQTIHDGVDFFVADRRRTVRGAADEAGFIGGTSDRPAPISDKEVDAIMNRLQQVGDKPRPKTLFEPGEMVRVNAK